MMLSHNFRCDLCYADPVRQAKRYYYLIFYWLFKSCFSRVYIWSPSINVDSTWLPVKEYTRDHIKPNDQEKTYFDNYEPSELEQIIKTNKKQSITKKNKNIKVHTKYLL